MECNREAADQCVLRAEAALLENDWAKALRLLVKGKNLYPLAGLEAKIQAVSCKVEAAELASVPVSPGESGESQARKRAREEPVRLARHHPQSKGAPADLPTCVSSGHRGGRIERLARRHGRLRSDRGRRGPGGTSASRVRVADERARVARSLRGAHVWKAYRCRAHHQVGPRGRRGRLQPYVTEAAALRDGGCNIT